MSSFIVMVLFVIIIAVISLVSIDQIGETIEDIVSNALNVSVLSKDLMIILKTVHISFEDILLSKDKEDTEKKNNIALKSMDAFNKKLTEALRIRGRGEIVSKLKVLRGQTKNIELIRAGLYETILKKQKLNKNINDLALLLKDKFEQIDKLVANMVDNANFAAITYPNKVEDTKDVNVKIIPLIQNSMAIKNEMSKIELFFYKLDSSSSLDFVYFYSDNLQAKYMDVFEKIKELKPLVNQEDENILTRIVSNVKESNNNIKKIVELKTQQLKSNKKNCRSK